MPVVFGYATEGRLQAIAVVASIAPVAEQNVRCVMVSFASLATLA
jgi:hypothetical protein